MTAERSVAYRCVIRLIETHGADLLPEERDQIRAATDALLFCTDRVADRLLVKLGGCGPQTTQLAEVA